MSCDNDDAALVAAVDRLTSAVYVLVVVYMLIAPLAALLPKLVDWAVAVSRMMAWGFRSAALWLVVLVGILCSISVVAPQARVIQWVGSIAIMAITGAWRLAIATIL